VLLLAAVFFRASAAPIWHLDTWSHWKYGQWIWQHGRLPEREPFSLYSDPNLPLVDTWWLSQVIGYLVYAAAGMEGIALLYGLAEVTRTALYLVAYRRVVEDGAGPGEAGLRWAVLGVGLLEATRWTFFGVFRPQVLGEVCWAALLAACARPVLSRAALAGVPLCVALWANLHGAFPLAFVLLGVLLAGRLGERAWALGGLGPAWQEVAVRRLALALALAVAAACVNPYGPRLLAEAARFGSQPVLRYVREWQPLAPAASVGGTLLLGSVLAVLATVRRSRRRFPPAEAALLLLFGLAAWFSARMVPWWATVWPWVLLPHWAIADRRLQVADWASNPQPAICDLQSAIRRLLPVALLLTALVLLLCSGTGRWLLRGRPRPVEQQVTAVTPVELTGRLKAWLAQPGGAVPLRVFNWHRWGDYLLWELPPAAQVYVYSHAHCYSVRRLEDGERLRRLDVAPVSWRALLDRYRFNAVVLEAEPGSPLFGHLRQDAHDPASQWQILYDNAPSRLPATGAPEAAGPFPAGASGAGPGGGTRDLRGLGLVAVRRVDPFVLTLANAQGVQACVGGLGLAPLAGSWSFLTHLPWSWRER
jgi:hypothetical protein